MGNIFYVLGAMGSGKTLFSVMYAYEFLRKNPYFKVYSNFKLKLPNCEYSPRFLIDFDELSDCLMIVDDCYALRNQSFIDIVVNMSRKKNMEVLFTLQYYTMVPPIIRKLSRCIRPHYYPEYEMMEIFISDEWDTPEFESEQWVAYNCSRFYGLYDTTEIVVTQLESEIVADIIKIATTKREFELYLSLAFKNKATVRRLLKEYASLFDD